MGQAPTIKDYPSKVSVARVPRLRDFVLDVRSWDNTRNRMRPKLSTQGATSMGEGR